MSKSSIDPELAWKTLLDNYSGTSNLIKQWMTSGKLSQAEGGEISHNLQVQREAFQREAAAARPCRTCGDFFGCSHGKVREFVATGWECL